MYACAHAITATDKTRAKILLKNDLHPLDVP